MAASISVCRFVDSFDTVGLIRSIVSNLVFSIRICSRSVSSISIKRLCSAKCKSLSSCEEYQVYKLFDTSNAFNLIDACIRRDILRCEIVFMAWYYWNSHSHISFASKATWIILVNFCVFPFDYLDYFQ